MKTMLLLPKVFEEYKDTIDLQHNSKSCFNCKYLLRYGDYCNFQYDPEVYYYFQCSKKPIVNNLKQFPFKNTKCLLFIKKVNNGL